ncbi:MAG: hypothetical protein H6R15_4399 [Proteobacteria bacterium]|nr:hypothetical protein [Pseudomonadota bacterium]
MVSSISGSVSSWTSTLFSQLDTSNKGYISESDLSSAFSLLDSNASDASNSASKLFSSLDNNNDGKVTEDELASTLQALSDQLNSQYDASRMASAMGHGMPPPPPPPAEGNQNDAGLTEDELTSIASTTTDSKLASLMSNAASNFSAADTNGDGKVSGAEAMAYQQTNSSSTESSDTGLTQDQMSAIASTTQDSGLASLMNSVVSNFSAADSNGDGKVSRAEAMAHKESSEANSSSNTTTSSATDNETMKRILALLQAYSSQGSTASSSLSLTA